MRYRRKVNCRICGGEVIYDSNKNTIECRCGTVASYPKFRINFEHWKLVI
jgi:hypothetical protein